VGVRREASVKRKPRCTSLQVETLRLSQLAEQARARSAQIDADLAEVQAQLDDLQERRETAEGRFESLDLQLADSQERHAEMDERVIDLQRKLTQCREQQRSLERQAQEAQFAQRSLQARTAELARTIDTADQQTASVHAEALRAREELARLTDAAAQAGLQNALALKLEREQAAGRQTQRIRRPDRQAARQRRTPSATGARAGALAPAHHGISAQGAGRAPGF
jgi:chromosome segregation protein